MPEPKDKGQTRQYPVSRRELLENKGRDIEMPPLEAGAHLLGYLFEFGPTMPSGMGNAPVSFSEMESWARSVGIKLQPWEARALRRLSGDYLSESNKATKPGCPPPFVDSRAARQFKAIATQDRLRKFLTS